MRKFEVGDRVRLKEQGKWRGQWDGDKVVSKVYDQRCICLPNSKEGGLSGGFRAEQLELIEDIVIPTDEEIAAQYRQARLDMNRLCHQLWDRGFTIQFSNGQTYGPESPRIPPWVVKVTKTTTTVTVQEI